MNFLKFKNAVAKQFKKMSDAKLYQTDVDKDTLWETYLSSFPEGTNLMFRERTEHDCNCCKQFIYRTLKFYSTVAQLVERAPEERSVGSSILSSGT